MPKSKCKSEHKSNIPSTDGENSTCGEVYPTYSHRDGGSIRTDPYNTLYYCPAKCDVPNSMHGAESRIDLKTCIFCYHRLTKKKYHKK